MSEFKYCQGPICHEHKTKDRIRGPKGDKHYETRKRSRFYYGGNFCSLNCQDDWFREYGNRTTYTHYFINDLLGERRPITEQQYDDKDLVRPS